MKRLASTIVALLLAGCASHPPPPDWQGNAKSASERAVGQSPELDSLVRLFAAILLIEIVSLMGNYY